MWRFEICTTIMVMSRCKISKYAYTKNIVITSRNLGLWQKQNKIKKARQWKNLNLIFIGSSRIVYSTRILFRYIHSDHCWFSFDFHRRTLKPKICWSSLNFAETNCDEPIKIWIEISRATWATNLKKKEAKTLQFEIANELASERERDMAN